MKPPEAQPQGIELVSRNLREFLNSQEMDFLNSTDIAFYEIFGFNGLTFTLLGTAEEEPAWFSASTETPGGWDIYLNEKLSPEGRKRELFHEILEIVLLTSGHGNDESHKQALMQEESLFGSR